jgi:hypothetical protein
MTQKKDKDTGICQICTIVKYTEKYWFYLIFGSFISSVDDEDGSSLSVFCKVV